MESGEGEEVNIEELGANLSTYKDQLHQVRKLLNDDPKNSEYLEMKELVEVIALTEELLETTKQSDGNSVPISGTSTEASPKPRLSESLLHGTNSNGDNGDKLPVGTKVQAVWSDDGEWYVSKMVFRHTEGSIYACTHLNRLFILRFFTFYSSCMVDLVEYSGMMEQLRRLLLMGTMFTMRWGNKEEVDPDNVRAIEEGSADPLVEAGKVAVPTKEALKRKISQAARKEFESWTLPPKLHIDPNDSEDVKATKRKKIHAFKSKMRLEVKEVAQNKRQNAWQQFQTTKGKSKKVGFFSGRKRESIFKSSEDPFGKVGVTGSGKGLTEFQKREKHLHLKGANIEGSED